MVASAPCTCSACRAIRSRPMSARRSSWSLSSGGSPAAAISRPHPIRRASVAICRQTTSARTTCAPRWRLALTASRSRRRRRCRTVPCSCCSRAPTACLCANRMRRPPRQGSAAPSSGSRASANCDKSRPASRRSTRRGEREDGPQGLAIRPTRSKADFGPVRPAPGAAADANPCGSLGCVHAKLNGCGTHIEHIVSVHDLFRRVSRGPPQWGKCKMLTRKQFELLRFIHERLKEDGVPPSFDQMKDALDLRSKSGIHRLITALEERGFIRRLPNRARAIEVIKLPDSVPHGMGAGRLRGFTPSVIEGNLGRVRTASEDEGGRPVAVPVMGRIAAGTPIEAIQTKSHVINMPPDVLSTGEHFALEVRGDSMIEAGILDGDIALLKKTDGADTGDIVVALIDEEEATLKRFRRRGASIALEPANTAYEVRILPPNRVRIQGKLVGLFRRY